MMVTVVLRVTQRVLVAVLKLLPLPTMIHEHAFP